eukprot:jgi/Tetstr1/455745/TSEL_042544.t1
MAWEEEVAARRTKAAVVATRRELKGRPAKPNNVEGVLPIAVVGGASYGVVWWLKHGRREYGRQVRNARKRAVSLVQRGWAAFLRKIGHGKRTGTGTKAAAKPLAAREAAAKAAENRQRQAQPKPTQAASQESTASAPAPAVATPTKVAPPSSGPTKSKKKKGKKKGKK